MKHKHFLCLGMALCAGFGGTALAGEAACDTILIPERAVAIHGDLRALGKDILAVFYSRENLSFQDPDAPRFLLIDRQGKVALGIGGSVYATASYDFGGAIGSSGFTTYDINVPNNPGANQRLGADLSHSSLFLKLIGKSSVFGTYEVYVQSNFTGNEGGYGFKLKQAYARLGNFMAGLTNSTFVDPATEAPTIDSEGPTGQITSKNILFRYTTPRRQGWQGAISVEMPSASYTTGDHAEATAQRVPTIPAYVQYGWGASNHVRLSAIFRDLAYRDLVTGKNHLQPAWGVHLSAISGIDPAGVVRVFGHVAYGTGIAKYVNGMSGNGWDLVESKDTAGELTAPRMMAFTAGAYFNITSRLMATASYSRAQTYGCDYLGGETYRYGQYAVVNAFYNVDSNLKVGAEYIRGWRTDYSGESGHANRANLLVQYSF